MEEYKLGKIELLDNIGRNKNGHQLGQYRCFCGNKFIARIYLVKIGNTISCGCYKRRGFNAKHRESKSRLYSIHRNMKKRCTNKNNEDYRLYGKRGISFCKKWKNYINFRDWALSNGYSKELTLDRIDVDGNYEPSNCRWVTPKIQAINQRNCKKNKSGIRGIYFCENCKSKPWRTSIVINGKSIYLGYFQSSKEASAVYEKAKKERDEMYYKEFNKKLK